MLSGALAKWFDEADIEDTAMVGGKGASLGEMYQKLSGIGVKVPNGFTLTTEAFREFVNAEIPESTWDNVGNPEGIEDGDSLQYSVLGIGGLSPRRGHI